MYNIGLIFRIYKKSMVMKMDIKQLQYFLTICEEGQITAAAKRLHMAQPPLSYQLKMLEEELGVELVLRGRHRIQLTDAGELLREKAEQICRLCDDTKKEVQDAKQQVAHQLRIGIVSSSHHAFLENGIQKFHQAYPKVSFIVKEGNTFQILDMLEKGLIEIGIVRTPFPQKNVISFPFWEEGMVAVCDVHRELSKHSCIQLSELAGVPLIYYERYASLLEDCFLQSGLLPERFCVNQDARTSLLWAKAGLGVAIVPKSAIILIDHKDLRIYDIDHPRLTTSIHIICMKDRYLSQTAQAFMEFYKEKSA